MTTCSLIPKIKYFFIQMIKVNALHKSKKGVIIAFVILCLIYCIVFRIKSTTTDENVVGWEMNKSRYAKDYIFPERYTTLTVVKNPCIHQHLQLLIIVCSEVGRGDSRQAIRETWGARAKHHNIPVLFLAGVNENEYSMLQLMNENEKHLDVVVENFVDSYNNLTIKSIMMLKWVKQNCQSTKFIMKVDDDVYLNVDNLVNVIRAVKDEEVPEYLRGKLYTRERPYRALTSKWYMPKYMFPEDAYPHYLCGVGYIMSIQVALRLYDESLEHEIVYLEDLFLTGVCAKNANITPREELAFRFFEHYVTVECNSIHPHLILLSHHISASQLRKTHKQILEC